MDQRPARFDFWAWYTPPWRHGTAVVVLFFIIFSTYRPSLWHPPRQDQWSFLIDTVKENGFLPMFSHTYSYNRTRVAGWGDYPLFRPVLFALLSGEKALFGPRYLYWQAVGIVLHCAIVWVFLRILLRLHQIYPTTSTLVSRLRLALAYILALFFGVNFVGTEIVSWCHIHGYLLYVLLVLGSMLLLLDELCGSPERPFSGFWRLGGAFVLTLLASFTYETGSLYAVCLGGVLAMVSAGRGKVRRGLLLLALFASILLVYRAADGIDRLSHPETRPDITEATILARAHFTRTINHARRYLLFTLIQPFFPSCPEWSFQERLSIPEPRANPQAYWRLEPFLFLSYAVVLTAAGLTIWQLGRLLANRRLLSTSLFLLVPATLIGLHMGIIVFGRMNMRPGPLVLARNSYYAYTPLLALLLALYYLWVRVPLARPRASVVLVVIISGLAILSWFSAVKVHAMVAQIRLDYRLLRGQINCVQKLIDQHRHDPHFAISFDPDLFRALAQDHGISRMEILFDRFIDHEHPTHIVCATGENWFVLGEIEYRDRYGLPRYRQLPTFIGPGTKGFMVYRRQHDYYALHYQEGHYRQDQNDYYYLIHGHSLAEVLQRIPATVKRIEADRRNGRYIPPQVSVVPLDEVYAGFALYQASNLIYAIPETEGPLVPTSLVNHQYSSWYFGPSVAAVQRLIDRGEPGPRRRRGALPRQRGTGQEQRGDVDRGRHESPAGRPGAAGGDVTGVQ
jgi:hypothetical protein